MSELPERISQGDLGDGEGEACRNVQRVKKTARNNNFAIIFAKCVPGCLNAGGQAWHYKFFILHISPV